MATTAEIGYVAGIIDSEGWMRSSPPLVVVKMTDEDVVRRLQRITSVGNVTGLYLRPGRKPIWQWTVGCSRDVAALLMTVFHLLGARRRARAVDVLTAWRAMPIGTRQAAACGTPSGYQAHLRRNETTCSDCRAAHRGRLAAWRTS